MGRNVFLSVLGASDYTECKYGANGEKFISKSVKFVQEAILEYLDAANWDAKSKGFIFVTEGSKLKNWQGINKRGLQNRLHEMKLPFEIVPVDIDEGKNEEEIWKLFKKIYNKLDNNDQVYFDLTHGYRYLPMLVMVLFNYAKLLKNIQIKSITYGNWEARNENDIAPIMEFTAFSNLQEWTNAFNEFVTSGNTNQLVSTIKQTARNSSGPQKQNLEKFANTIKKFTLDLTTVRGKDIYSGKTVALFHQSISILKKKTDIPVLTPIIEKFENKIFEFNDKQDFKNGEIAIKWCIDHGLIQQAYTLGQEHIISVLCEYFSLDYTNKEDREFLSQALGYINRLNQNPQEDIYPMLKSRIDLFDTISKNTLINNIASNYNTMSGFRNSINHGGMVGKISNQELIENFTTFYYPIIELLKDVQPCS